MLDAPRWRHRTRLAFYRADGIGRAHFHPPTPSRPARQKRRVPGVPSAWGGSLGLKIYGSLRQRKEKRELQNGALAVCEFDPVAVHAGDLLTMSHKMRNFNAYFRFRERSP